MRGLIVLGAALLLLVAAPFLIPLSTYIPRLEQLASEAIREPVKIGGLGVALLPWPQASASGIVIGKASDIKVGKVTVVPDLFSLFAATKVIRSIEIRDATATQDALARMPNWAGGGEKQAAAAPALRVERLRLDKARIVLPKATLGPLDAEAELAADGALRGGFVRTEDRKLTLDFKPEGELLKLEGEAKDWTLPVGPAVRFDALKLAGTLSKTELNLPSITSRLYGGTTSGAANLSFKDAWRLRGEFVSSQVELQNLVPLFSPSTKVSGRLDAKTRLASSAKGAGQLLDALRVESNFNVKQGVLYGVDLVEAVKSPFREGKKGGKTEFDELSGTVVSDAAGQRFSNLKVSSGVLAASGNVNIAKTKELSGRVNAEVKAGVSAIEMPLQVAGTVDSPLVYPTKGALAGAAAGTAVLGPGAGTAAGTKAGGFFDKLFGGDEKKKK